MDPKLFARFRSEKIIPDPGPSSPRSEINLKKNYYEKLIKFDNISAKCSIKKHKFLFVKKIFP